MTSNIGKWIIIFGIGVILIGLTIWFLGKTGVPLGKLPGDLSIRKEKFGLYTQITSRIGIIPRSRPEF